MPESQIEASKHYHQGKLPDYFHFIMFYPRQVFWKNRPLQILRSCVKCLVINGLWLYLHFSFLLYVFTCQLLITEKQEQPKVYKTLIFSLQEVERMNFLKYQSIRSPAKGDLNTQSKSNYESWNDKNSVISNWLSPACGNVHSGICRLGNLLKDLILINYSAVTMNIFLSFYIICLYLIYILFHISTCIIMETLTLLLEVRVHESKAFMYITNIPQIIFNANPHFFSPKSYSIYTAMKKILT